MTLSKQKLVMLALSIIIISEITNKIAPRKGQITS